jgi:D-aminoacyl-tRNA deacylase
MEKDKKFLGIMFECCNIYRRIYINKGGNAYEGRCPKCFAMVKVSIGPGGSDNRMFRARWFVCGAGFFNQNSPNQNKSMKIVLQRVSRASVTVQGEVIASISKGLLILFGAEKNDDEDKVQFLAEKTINLRIFSDEKGKMNLSCLDISGEVLVVSQFTLAGDCTKGRRPGFDNAAAPEAAQSLYQNFIQQVVASGLKVATGEFGADMQVELINDGPATFTLER